MLESLKKKKIVRDVQSLERFEYHSKIKIYLFQYILNLKKTN